MKTDTETAFKIARNARSEAVEVTDSRTYWKPCQTLGAGAEHAAEHTAKLTALMDSAVGSLQFLPQMTEPVIRTFAGYGRLQALSQDAIIRMMILTRTDEMLRRWIEIKDDDADRVQQITDWIEQHQVRATLQKAVATMGFFGGAYLFVDTGETKNRHDPLNWSDKSGELKPGNDLGFRVIHPLFTTPQTFNAVDPLAADFYKPSVFLVMGKPVHRSRLIRFCENEVAEILKPSYNFLGIPQAQLLEDYVNDFRSNREAVNRLLKKFSSSFLKTNLKNFLYSRGSRAEVDRRIEHFVRWRNNDGVSLIDKDTEDFAQTNTPISGLDALLSQSLQFIVAVNRTNVVKTLGISPAGFNTGDSDIKVHNDLIAALQEKVLREPITQVLKAICLHLFGDAKAPSFSFRPLNEEDARAVADTEKVRADTRAVYLDHGVISPDEARMALAQDEGSSLSDIAAEGDAPGMEGSDDPFAALLGETNGEEKQ